MGDPKFQRPLYDTPFHPWQAERIAAEKDLVLKYGLKNKTELWRFQSKLRRFRGQARVLLGKQNAPTAQSKKETVQVLTRLARIGVLPPNSTLDDILALNVEQVLTRRFQTLVYLKGLAHSPEQARQFIVHGHVIIGDRRVRVPGHLVTRDEEQAIAFSPRSALSDEGHPVRPKPLAPGETRKMKERRPPPDQRRGGFGRGPPRGGPRGGGSGGGRGPPRGGGSRPGGGSRGGGA